MNRRILSSVSLFAVALVSSFPAYAADVSIPENPPTQSLYERLGGEAAITAVVDDFVGRAAADPAVHFTRKGTPKEWDATPENVATLKKHLTQFICSATGGPQIYEGKDLKATHEGMGISESEFGAIAADLKTSLNTFNVPQKEQDDLLTIVGTTQGSIVEKSEAPATS